MNINWKFWKKETKFGLVVGQKKAGLMNETWVLISRSAQIMEFLGHGDLSAADIKRISDEIGEDQIFLYGNFGKKKIKTIPVLALLLEIDLKRIEGMVVKGKIYQVTEGNVETRQYPLDKKEVDEYNEGKRKKEEINFVTMTDIRQCDAYSMLMEFIKL